MHRQEPLYKEALNNAIASVEMEGYDVNDSQKKICLEFVSGKIDKEHFIKIMLERCKN